MAEHILETHDTSAISEQVQWLLTALQNAALKPDKEQTYTFDIPFKSDLTDVDMTAAHLHDFVQPILGGLFKLPLLKLGLRLNAPLETLRLQFVFQCVDNPMIEVRLTAYLWKPTFPEPGRCYWQVNGFTRQGSVRHRFPSIALLPAN